MKAAVVHRFGQPLAIEDVPVPEPGPEQVLVRIETCGLCHTDIHAARGDWPIQPALPFVPGHEGVGIVERVGAGNSHGIQPGMRVALPWLGYACGDCAYCNSGRETLCESQRNTGYFMDGGFAEYAVAFARHVVRVPAGIDPADASPLTCAGVTTYKAVKVAGASSADLIAVFGVGGLGHLAVQYAAITGARVVAVDINEQRLRTARRLGADEVVHAGEEDPVAAIRRLGGAQAGISTAVHPIAFEQAFGSLARGGTLVCVGLPAENAMRLPIFETVLGGLTVVGSIVGTHHDLEEVFALHARGKTVVERTEVPLDDVNAAIASVLDGSAGTARLVLRPVWVPGATAQIRPARGGAAAGATAFDHTGAFAPGGVIGLPTHRSGGTVAGR
ncbi:MAG: zinc-dependent alcohol dehydrogenase [Thermoleophilia bacterium]